MEFMFYKEPEQWKYRIVDKKDRRKLVEFLAGEGQMLAPLRRLIETTWLAANLGEPGLKVVDLRPQLEYNAGHVPGAVALKVESLWGGVYDVPSMPLPAGLLAEFFC